MIASLSGIVKHSTLNSAVIEVGGIGILVLLPARFAASLLVGTHAEIATTLVVREDSLTLYGFENSQSRDCFELLQTVSGIGPKVAQSALSIYDPKEISTAIISGNSGALERIPGLGKKGAARTILELKEKMASLDLQGVSTPGQAHWRTQLTSALVSLGYSSRESEQRVEELSRDKSLNLDSKTISEILKLALQIRGSS